MTNNETLKQALAAAEAAYKADAAKANALRSYDRVVNEGGEGYSTAEAASEAAFNKHMPLIKAAKNALFAATWTPDYFAACKALWNLEIAKTKSITEKVALEKRLGFTLRELQDAKALLGA